jgi:hypothetical protein
VAATSDHTNSRARTQHGTARKIRQRSSRKQRLLERTLHNPRAQPTRGAGGGTRASQGRRPAATASCKPLGIRERGARGQRTALGPGRDDIPSRWTARTPSALRADGSSQAAANIKLSPCIVVHAGVDRTSSQQWRQSASTPSPEVRCRRRLHRASHDAAPALRLHASFMAPMPLSRRPDAVDRFLGCPPAVVHFLRETTPAHVVPCACAATERRPGWLETPNHPASNHVQLLARRRVATLRGMWNELDRKRYISSAPHCR